MAALSLLAEGAAHGLWNPTIIGVLTVLCAVGLFCGSAYLLLSTNLGGRLGFLIAAAGLSGFLVLLTTLWLTTPGSATGNSDLDPPHGDVSGWKVIDLIAAPTDSKSAAVRDLPSKGCTKISGIDNPICANRPRVDPANADLLTQVKPAIDAAIVPPNQVAGVTPPVQPFATLDLRSGTDYLVDFPGAKSYYYIDKTQNFFWHRHRYAAIELCLTRKDANGATITTGKGPTCDQLKNTHYAILSYTYGSVRKPVVMYWLFSLLAFGMSLLGLHWWERDERARRRAALAPVLTPVSEPAPEPVPEPVS